MTPRRIILDSEPQVLRLSWSDGHESVYPLDGLRRACPCAGCAGGHERMGELPDPEVFRQPATRRWESVRVEPVGTYAIRIVWDDGHDAGIHTWKRLRAICPCAACSG
jgi:DUF971 family protein